MTNYKKPSAWSLVDDVLTPNIVLGILKEELVAGNVDMNTPITQEEFQTLDNGGEILVLNVNRLYNDYPEFIGLIATQFLWNTPVVENGENTMLNGEDLDILGNWCDADSQKIDRFAILSLKEMHLRRTDPEWYTEVQGLADLVSANRSNK